MVDSLLKSQVGDRLFQYFSISDGSYYSYVDKRNKNWTGKFLSKNRLPKSFVTLNFLYHFNYPEIEGVRSGTWLIVDRDFKQINTLNLGFIPYFLKDDKPSNFISFDSSLIIAKNNFTQKGLVITTPELSYNNKLKLYTYTICNELTRTLNQAGKDSGEMEVIEINAVTGKIERLEKSYYGVIIR